MLEDYNRKRDFDRTPEPKGPGGPHSPGPLRFVVQMHDARRLHYDFRIELDGVLISWAVPKGPTLDPNEKRLAVKVEDHPIDYGAFEGIIPEQEYGAGEVIVWDRGTYSPDEDGEFCWDNRERAQNKVREGLARGKISIFLEGEKLRGSFAFVKLKNKDKEWLLIKHKDSFAKEGFDIEAKPSSVDSGRTLADVREGMTLNPHPQGWPSPLLEKGDLRPFPKQIAPMLASPADAPFMRKGWVFEPKLDGIRAICYVQPNKVTILSRNGNDLSSQYPALCKDLAQLGLELVLDGEIIALDETGRPSFQMLQQRMNLTKAQDIRRAEEAVPATYYVFDILHCNGRALDRLPFKDRRAILKTRIPGHTAVKLIQQFDEDGEAAYAVCTGMGLEGVVGKRIDSIYEQGRRSQSWLKLKSSLSDDFIVGGYTEGTGSRKASFGSLILGQYNEKGELDYVGGVGTGFDSSMIDEMLALMKPLVTAKCPFKRRPQDKTNPTWIKPQIVVEVKFAQRTKDKILRWPVFLRVRDELAASDAVEKQVVVSQSVRAVAEPAAHYDTQDALARECLRIVAQLQEAKETLDLLCEGNKIAFSNLSKVFWPADKIAPVTKRDYAIYLAGVAPYVLPHLKDRPLTMVRYPNGIYKSRFYQKHWEKGLPHFVETIGIFSETNQGDGEFLICNNLSTLIWLAQIADLELHTSHARINYAIDGGSHSRTFTGSEKNLEGSLLNYPDFLIFDLDPYLYSGSEKPGEEPELHDEGFQKACDVAFYLKETLDHMSIKSFIKTSGRTGLHIYIPIVRNVDYKTVREMCEIVGRQLLKEHSDKITMEYAVNKRDGKIFLDYAMNARGKSLASIYSPRVAAHASVSTPLTWQELRKVYPTDFTIHTLPARLKERGDIWRDILSHKNDLEKILGV